MIGFSGTTIIYLSCFEWEWFVTLGFRNRVSPDTAQKLYREWLKRLKTEERLCLAGYAVLVMEDSDNYHIHGLLLSEKRSYLSGLLDVDKEKWLRKWQHSNHVKIVTSKEASPNKWVGYICKEKNMTLFQPDRHDVIVTRPSLLKRMLTSGPMWYLFESFEKYGISTGDCPLGEVERQKWLEAKKIDLANRKVRFALNRHNRARGSEA